MFTCCWVRNAENEFARLSDLNYWKRNPEKKPNTKWSLVIIKMRRTNIVLIIWYFYRTKWKFIVAFFLFLMMAKVLLSFLLEFNFNQCVMASPLISHFNDITCEFVNLWTTVNLMRCRSTCQNIKCVNILFSFVEPLIRDDFTFQLVSHPSEKFILNSFAIKSKKRSCSFQENVKKVTFVFM